MVNVIKTKINDAGLEQLKGLTSLRELKLNSTSVTDAGLNQLNGMKQLNKLGLASTKVTGAGLHNLKALTALGLGNASVRCGSTRFMSMRAWSF